MPSTPGGDGGDDDATAGEASRLLAQWATSRLGPSRVRFAHPATAPPAYGGVNFHLVDVRTGPAGEVGFLVTSDAAEILADLVLASIDDPTFELDLGLPPSRSWPALGLRPQPAGYLRVRMPGGPPRRRIRRAGRRG